MSSVTDRGSTRQWRHLRALILRRDNYVCHWNHEHRADSVDHVVPRAEGGTDTPSNLVAACRSCNSRRAARWVNDRRRDDGMNGTVIRPGWRTGVLA